ncbi:polyphosphate kinase 1 [Pontiella sulfatireligans]|uniref:Polyphosphate kinase n=1 Tax=Pontiella sulfatireligans TaxID=2750658 RepID=A0A6C2UE79_9BACT|nr:polyphosphate kinase 1 [Pontiella sulfatireligans]VGO18428.1 Polyphosphate kinase [Pontiella sulfatireligans]
MAAKNEPKYFNRELSWLEFNQRVLEEAKDADNPMLERLKFLAITASNLDEFFMVRVGGLHMARKAGLRKREPSGLTPLAQLREVSKRARNMMTDLHRCFNEVVSPALATGGVRHASIDALTHEQETALFEIFSEELFPVITPMAVDPKKGMPLLQNLAMYLMVRLQPNSAKDTEDRFAIMPLARAGARIIQLPAEDGYTYVLNEEAVKKYEANWFPGFSIKESAVFRITRNADFAVQENEAPDLLSGMEDVLEERKTGDCIRLEVEASISKALLKMLCNSLPAEAENVYPVEGVLNLKDFMSMAFLEGFDELKTEAWPPQASPDVVPNEPMFGQISEKDLLFYHPYETFDPVVRFIEEAAVDPETMAIKMVLYRTSSDSAIIAALKRAAGNGINVTVLMELKARFDEARNIGWARDLEQCGAQVIYGVKGYKTHAKICLVVRREPAGVVRYCHFGTGNYNESTAKLYGDISYMTANPELGADASAFFNALCGYAQPQNFNLISMAPIGMRDKLMELIDFEISRARKGKKAFISAKVNSLVDVVLSDKLYEASKAGVKVKLNIRGICGLKPGVKGLSENIEVSSIIDRYLEHARIIHFCHGGKSRVFISSADWMPRNLDKRLELMVPVEDKACRDRLIDILNLHMADNQSSWQLKPNGSYERTLAKGAKKVRSQQVFYGQACEAIASAQKNRRTRFEPHRPDSKQG